MGDTCGTGGGVGFWKNSLLTKQELRAEMSVGNGNKGGQRGPRSEATAEDQNKRQ